MILSNLKTSTEFSKHGVCRERIKIYKKAMGILNASETRCPWESWMYRK